MAEFGAKEVKALRDATGGLPVARIRSMDEVVVQSSNLE